MSGSEELDDSPDIFDDCSPLEEVISQSDDNVPAKQSKSECERAWLGATLEDVRNGSAPTLPPVLPSEKHSVFFQVPIVCNDGSPKPYPRNVKDCWDSNHVRMPCSDHSLYPVQEEGAQRCLRQRWELVQEALLKSIVSSQQLEAAIMSYNSKYSDRWDFSVLHYLFSDVFSEEETTNFFTTLLPKIVRLALQLPTLLTGPVPLLVEHCNHTLSFSQLQIASILANAFLCTFPRRNTATKQSEYARYPDINFNRLYHPNGRVPVKLEKLKCLLHYFRRVCTKAPDGVVTYSRRYISLSNLPRWDRSLKSLTKLHITSEGTIEDEGEGMLQVDFANKFIGGGVLGGGAVQEEIRFVICPELIAARLFTESLDVTEALLIVGCERFSNYKGYADSFEWAGDYQDTTPRDSSNRRICSVVAIDAMRLGNRNVQYTPSSLMRELNKAYAGFHCPEGSPEERLAGVASGNWGCGAFRGDAKLKSLLQLMAASQAGRALAYFTFGDTKLRDEVFHIYRYLIDQQVTVGQLWRLLCQYYERSFRGGRQVAELYPFLYQALSDKKVQPSSTFFNSSTRRPLTVDRSGGEDEQDKRLSSKSSSSLSQHEHRAPSSASRQSTNNSVNESTRGSSCEETPWLSTKIDLKKKELKEALSTLPVSESNPNSRKSENYSTEMDVVSDDCDKSKWLGKDRVGLNDKELEEALASLPVKECNQNVGKGKETSSDVLASVSESCRSEDRSERKMSIEDSEKKRISLMDYLEQFDRNNSSSSTLVNSSPTQKRKISDYFSSVSKTKK